MLPMVMMMADGDEDDGASRTCRSTWPCGWLENNRTGAGRVSRYIGLELGPPVASSALVLSGLGGESLAYLCRVGVEQADVSGFDFLAAHRPADRSVAIVARPSFALCCVFGQLFLFLPLSSVARHIQQLRPDKQTNCVQIPTSTRTAAHSRVSKQFRALISA